MEVSTSSENNLYTKDYFERLPDEIIVHIFQFVDNIETLLSKCSQVCKRWKRLSVDISLWRTLTLDLRTMRIDKLKKILSFGVRSLMITFCGWKEYEDQSETKFQDVTKYNDLQDIFLMRARMTAEVFADILLGCINLEEITLCSQEINDQVCHCIAKNINLKTLRLSVIYGLVSASSISEIFKRCINLETIDIRDCQLSENIYSAIFDAIPECSNIKDMTLGDGEVLDKHIEKITERCPNLIKLNLLFCNNLTGNLIIFIIYRLQKLQVLSLDCNQLIAPESILKLRRHRSLTCLEILYRLKQFPVEIKEKLEDCSIRVKLYSSEALYLCSRE